MSHVKMERRLRAAGVLVSGGLLVEAFSLSWSHPLAFIVFAGGGGLLIGSGLLAFLTTLFQTGPTE